MTQEHEMEEFPDLDDSYERPRYGAFGRFSSNDSFPVEYFLTTLRADELKEELTFARDINPDNLDFDLMIQRDIDEERVKKEIEPYLLDGDGKQKKNINEKIAFFPPLLAAIVHVENKKMLEFYPDQLIEKDPQKPNHLIRHWPGLFKLTMIESNAANGYAINELEEDGEAKVHHVSKNSVKLELKKARGHSKGAYLVVIDGQHRLKALIDVYDRAPDLLEDLLIPICVMYPPHASEKYKALYNEKLPTVPMVFRKLFVDVNSTSKLVGGHFNILLRDNNLSSILCRNFCSRVLNEFGLTGLATIEWNEKNKKNSTQIQKAYSISSVGILDQAFEKILKKDNINKYLFELETNDSFNQLGDESSKGFKWDSFSLAQKDVLDQIAYDQVSKHVISLLWGIDEYKKLFDIVKGVIEDFEKRSKTNTQEATIYSRALEQILSYNPSTNKDVILKVAEFEDMIAAKRTQEIAKIVGYSIFHRAVFDFWDKMLQLGKNWELSPESVTKASVLVINYALRNKGEFFSIGRSYLTNTIYMDNGRVLGKVETSYLISNLLFAHIASDDVLRKMLDILDIEESERDYFSEKVSDRAITEAYQYLEKYTKNTRESFKKSYPVMMSIPSDERLALSEAQDRYERDLAEVKLKRLDKSQISNEFEKLVNKHVKEQEAEAYADLRDALNYNEEILQYSEIIEDDTDQDS